MKKLTLTIAIVLGLGLGLTAQDKGLFGRGYIFDEEYYGAGEQSHPLLPNHASEEDFDADGPLGSGLVLLAGLGAAYLVGKKRREE